MFSCLKACPAAVLEQSMHKSTWYVLSIHAWAASNWLGRFRLFAVLWLLKLCGMFKARRDRLQARHSVEVNVGGLSCCWHFGLSPKVATQLSQGFVAIVQTTLLCMLLVFPGRYIMLLPLCLGCLYIVKAFCVLQIATEKLLLKYSLLLCF